MNGEGPAALPLLPHPLSLVLPEAEAAELPLGMLHPDADGPLCLEHVVMQNTLIERAANLGAEVRRGVTGVSVQAGGLPP